MLDGREVLRFDGSSTVLRTAGATMVTSQFSFRQTFMETLAIPLVAYLLFSGGMLGLYVEFTHPGAIFPGVVGALCLLLFAISAQVLPVSSIGVLLILLAGVMFILEIKVVSFGMLTLGGIVCMLVGSLMLIDGPIPELQVPWTVVVPTTIVVTPNNKVIDKIEGYVDSTVFAQRIHTQLAAHEAATLKNAHKDSLVQK